MLNRHVVHYDFHNFRLDLIKQELLKDGEPVLLTHKAFQTLHILVQNCGQVVEKENIYNLIWADSFVEEANLTQYIYLLRKVLDKDPAGRPYIETISRRGYMFTADVGTTMDVMDDISPVGESSFGNWGRKLNGNSNHNSTSIALAMSTTKLSNGFQIHVPDAINGTIASTRESPVPQVLYRIRAIPRFLSIGLLFLGVISVFIFLSLLSNNKDVVSTGGNLAPKSLAVLPFKSIDKETQDSKLGFGMADAIITRLTSIQQIPVRPSSSIFRYIDDPTVTYALAGKELGVDTVLEGTVQRADDRVRISVQLFNVADGKPIWAESFDEKYTDVFSLQDSIALRVVNKLALKLTPQEWKTLEQHPTSDPAALEAYQLGVYYWNTRGKEDLFKAQLSFQKAVEIDPNFARAYAMLADTYNMLGYYRFADKKDMELKATLAVAKALEIDDSVPEAHIAMAFLKFTPDSADAAKKSIDRAIQLAPYNSTARLRRGWILLSMRDAEAAMNEMRLAREFDPLSPVSNGALCNILIYGGRVAESVEHCKKAVELLPDNMDSRLSLAEALFFSGNTDVAVAQTQLDVEQRDRKFSSMANLSFFLAKLGRRAESEAILTQLKTESATNVELLADIVLIEYALGNRDRSFEYFQRAYKKSVVPIMNFRLAPSWKDVRLDPRFAKVIDK